MLDRPGENWLAVEMWAQQATDAHLTNFTKEAGTPVWTSMAEPEMAPRPLYGKKVGSYQRRI
jgi:hypothetical protein